MRAIYILKAEEVCGNCKHFHYHYCGCDGRYHPLNCGHCVYPRMKNRQPGLAGCKNWETCSNDSAEGGEANCY